MAVPVLDFLTGRAREALPYLRAAAKRGLTPTAALAELVPLNLTFQRQRMLDVYNVLSARPDPQRVGRLVGDTTPLPIEGHAVSPVNLATNYQYVVGAFDEFGEPVAHVTVSSEVSLSLKDIRTLAGILFAIGSGLEEDRRTGEISAVSIEEANVSPSAPTP